jgi:diadenylate cyclase
MTLPPLTIRAAIDILAVAFIVYQLLQIIRGTRAAHILTGIIAVVIIYEIAASTGLEALRTLLASLAPYSAIAVIILFQNEIRRTLARLGRKRLFGFERPESIDEIVLALASFAREKIGALIILERDIGVRTFIESGVRLDSQISRDLLLSIFLPGTALHDGAVIIQKDRIAAAACFLPLSTSTANASKLGTRHRAGIGITEETDCLALIVSEETGLISIAAFGELERGVTLHRVDERINEHFGVARRMTTRGPGHPASEPAPAPAGSAQAHPAQAHPGQAAQAGKAQPSSVQAGSVKE